MIKLFKRLAEKEWLRIIIYIFGIFVFFYIFSLILGAFNITIDDIRAYAEMIGWWGPLFLILLTTVSLVFSPLSSSSVISLSVVLYGTVGGLLIGCIAGIAGGGIDYLLADKFGKKFIRRFIGPKTLEAVEVQGHRVKKQGFIGLIMLMPFSIDLVSYAAGLVKFDKSHYIAALVLGTIIHTSFVVFGTSGFLHFF